MVVYEQKATDGQLNPLDRLSDLPDSILHHIISFLGTAEACRTSILAKTWAHIWSTGLILDFKPQYLVPKIDGDFVESSTGPYSDETIDRLMSFIESTMLQYSEKNLSIKIFRLEYPIIDPDMAERIDRWVGIALRNQVEELSLSVIPDDPPSYKLPAILFFSKSLMSMKLCRVRLPYLKNAKLISLQSLDLTKVDVDEQMLQDIIMSCPLKNLKLDRCSGLQNISIPCCSRLESLHVARSVPIGGTISVDTISLQCLTYNGYDDSWPVILTPASKKNLKELCIIDVDIGDDSFGKLVSELPSIENITLFDCIMESCTRIASQTLKELRIHDCYEVNVMLDAPELHTFCYNGEWQYLSSVINSHNNYNAYFHLTVINIDDGGFYFIKQLLSKSSCCKVLSITVSDEQETPQIELDTDELQLLNRYSPSDPTDIPELKLSVSCQYCTLEESTCRALIDGLLWCCRPDILSVSFTSSDNSMIKTFLEILQKKVKYWNHPLKRMELEGANCSSLLLSWDLEVRLRLYW
ncbi:putative F-box/LRR-repeat protein At4g15060 [Silene latifolia]|uniref:putative F-box/LRR-repeat protein At4g15060 n=1 Tax=Silene latifolia TaxID=37657 RepID=UPI003D7780C1